MSVLVYMYGRQVGGRVLVLETRRHPLDRISLILARWTDLDVELVIPPLAQHALQH